MHNHRIYTWRVWHEKMTSIANITGCEEGSDSLVAKSSDCKSPVWMHFGFEADGEGKLKWSDVAVCRLCRKTVSAAKRDNTFNLFSHLRVHHPLQHMKLKKVSSAASGKTGESSKMGKFLSFLCLSQPRNMSKRARSGRNLPTRWHTVWQKTWCQFYSVEKEGFRQLLQSFHHQ